MPKSKDNKAEHRGFGFVTFETDAAIKRVVGAGSHRLRNSTIAIDIAMPKEDDPSPPPAFGGGAGGGAGAPSGSAAAAAAAVAAAAAAFDPAGAFGHAGLGLGGLGHPGGAGAMSTPGFDAAAAAVAGLAAARQFQAAAQMPMM
jgi:hypothetical protein